MLYDDNDPRLSPLWRGQRRPFNLFQLAIFKLGLVYRVADAPGEEEIRISVTDTNGQTISGSQSIPVSAFDDLLFAVQEIGRRRSEENTRVGFNQELWADRAVARVDKLTAQGQDPEAEQARARDNYAEAALRAAQPDDIPT